MATNYSVEDKKLIKKLKADGIELTGEESSDELRTMSEKQALDEAENSGEAEEIDGVPNKLPVREIEIIIANKPMKLPIFFVATVKGGKQAMYNYEGQRVSPAYAAADTLAGSVTQSTPNGTNAVQHLNKMCAKFNAQRQRGILSPADIR